MVALRSPQRPQALGVPSTQLVLVLWTVWGALGTRKVTFATDQFFRSPAALGGRGRPRPAPPNTRGHPQKTENGDILFFPE